jgi:hypothetical protein
VVSPRRTLPGTSAHCSVAGGTTSCGVGTSHLIGGGAAERQQHVCSVISFSTASETINLLVAPAGPCMRLALYDLLGALFAP